MSQIEKAKFFFQNLNKNNMDTLVPDFYAPDVEFIDPIHSIKGELQIREYYRALYQDVKEIRFDFSRAYQDHNTIILVWKMTLITPNLKGGEPVVVDGNSIITFNEKGQAIFHQDYFDMGAFIYENIPVLGFVVRKIKERLK